MKATIPPKDATATVVQACHSIYQFALHRRMIVPAARCEKCHSTETLAGHHPDYAVPLEVQWLCPTCHVKAHGKQRVSESHKRRMALFASGSDADLTPRQQEVLDFVSAYCTENQKPPTIREIGAALNIRSPNGVMCHMDCLVRKGKLLYTPNVSRGYRLAAKAVPA